MLERCNTLLSLKASGAPQKWENSSLTALQKAAMLLTEIEHELPQLQLELLQKNWWLAKPVDGAMGKGIVLFGGMPSAEDLNISALPFTGRMSEGYVLQKYLEKPHLINISSLVDLDNKLHGRTREVCGHAFYKYNLRVLVLVRWVEDPSVWVYDKGYIDLCPIPFAEAFGDEAEGAHISNLAFRGHTAEDIRKRIWSTDTFREYLQQTSGRDVWAEDIVPQVRDAISRIIGCIGPLKSGLTEGARQEASASKPGRQPWRRFGFDFALDHDFHVWLVEANHRPGMKAPRGPSGEDKRRFLDSSLN